MTKNSNHVQTVEHTNKGQSRKYKGTMLCVFKKSFDMDLNMLC